MPLLFGWLQKTTYLSLSCFLFCVYIFISLLDLLFFSLEKTVCSWPFECLLCELLIHVLSPLLISLFYEYLLLLTGCFLLHVFKATIVSSISPCLNTNFLPQTRWLHLLLQSVIYPFLQLRAPFANIADLAINSLLNHGISLLLSNIYPLIITSCNYHIK